MNDKMTMLTKSENISLTVGGEIAISYGERKLRYLLIHLLQWWVYEVITQGRGP